MSMFNTIPTGYAALPYCKYRACDYRASLERYQPQQRAKRDVDIRWTRSRLMGGGGLFQPDLALSAPVWFEYPAHASKGARSCYVIEGYTQDADGNPLDGCRVRAFNTANRTFRGECNSNSNGFYRLGVYVAGPYFLLAHRDGAPDLGGASNDDVMPT
jgi:hypothetical protein